MPGYQSLSVVREHISQFIPLSGGQCQPTVTVASLYLQVDNFTSRLQWLILFFFPFRNAFSFQ